MVCEPDGDLCIDRLRRGSYGAGQVAARGVRGALRWGGVLTVGVRRRPLRRLCAGVACAAARPASTAIAWLAAISGGLTCELRSAATHGLLQRSSCRGCPGQPLPGRCLRDDCAGAQCPGAQAPHRRRLYGRDGGAGSGGDPGPGAVAVPSPAERRQRLELVATAPAGQRRAGAVWLLLLSRRGGGQATLAALTDSCPELARSGFSRAGG